MLKAALVTLLFVAPHSGWAETLPCGFDNDPVPGHYVEMSIVIPGACHDAGAQGPEKGRQIIGKIP